MLLPIAFGLSLLLAQPADPSPATPDSEPAASAASGPAHADSLPAAADEIVVTATGIETPLGEVAAAVTVLGEDDLGAAPASTLDETLRRVPGFTLFRRSGSRTSNPTTHGVSLRGVGGSGAGRALVLADGVPVADPFGGWVPWGLVPTISLARVEVLRGGASDLYGSAALAGVVHLLRRKPEDGEWIVDLSAGGQGTAAGSVWMARESGRWAGALAAEGFTSDGYVQVAREDRGPVDEPAGGRHGSAELSLERRPAPRSASPRVQVRLGLFDEARENGTPLQKNARTIRHGSLGLDRSGPDGAWSLRAWASEHDLAQTFSAVADDRATERLVREQAVPAERIGGSARWIGALSSSHTVVAGLEAGRVEGRSEERIHLPGRTLRTTAGGVQEEAALYVEDLATLGRGVSVAASLRHDRWRNLPDAPGEVERAESAWSPRLALRWRARPEWNLFASGYRSLRAPTLNELYRGFRVGDVVTAPNPALEAERLTGAEAGALWEPAMAAGGLRLRTSLFWMAVEDPVANVTVAAGPELVERQRRNLGRIRSRGLELEAHGRLGRRWRLAIGYLLSEATVERYPTDRTLEGLRVPQVPEHQATLRLRRLAARSDLVLDARWSSTQFDDDRNRFLLEELLRLDLRAAWRPWASVELYLSVENLLDEQTTIGRTPVRTVASPRLVRIGARWQRRGI